VNVIGEFFKRVGILFNQVPFVYDNNHQVWARRSQSPSGFVTACIEQ
jgi:hypothetical protein